MRTRFCVCGHNFFSHDERKKSSWRHMFKDNVILRIVFASCRIPHCRCDNYVDAIIPEKVDRKVEIDDD